MKVKYIYGTIWGFENEINEFITDKNVIDIKFQEDHDTRSALVLYEDEQN